MCKVCKQTMQLPEKITAQLPLCPPHHRPCFKRCSSTHHARSKVWLTVPAASYYSQKCLLCSNLTACSLLCVPLCGWRKVKEGESQFYLYCVNCKSFLKNYWFFLELIWPNNACLCECCWLCYFVLCRGVQHWPRSEAAWFCVCSLESSGGGEEGGGKGDGRGRGPLRERVRRGVVWRPNVCGTLQFSLFLIGVRDICVSAELYFISLLESSLV